MLRAARRAPSRHASAHRRHLRRRPPPPPAPPSAAEQSWAALRGRDGRRHAGRTPRRRGRYRGARGCAADGSGGAQSTAIQCAASREFVHPAALCSRGERSPSACVPPRAHAFLTCSRRHSTEGGRCRSQTRTCHGRGSPRCNGRLESARTRRRGSRGCTRSGLSSTRPCRGSGRGTGASGGARAVRKAVRIVSGGDWEQLIGRRNWGGRQAVPT